MGSRRKRAMCPQVLDINIRDHTMQVDKNKRKCIVYILDKATLQFLVEEIFKDLRESHAAAPTPNPKLGNMDRMDLDRLGRVDPVLKEHFETNLDRCKRHPNCSSVSWSPSRLRVRKSCNTWTWVPLKGLSKRIRLGDVDGCTTLIDRAVEAIMEDLAQYQDPVADAALGHHGEDEAKEHQDNAATVAAEAGRASC